MVLVGMSMHALNDFQRLANTALVHRRVATTNLARLTMACPRRVVLFADLSDLTHAGQAAQVIGRFRVGLAIIVGASGAHAFSDWVDHDQLASLSIAGSQRSQPAATHSSMLANPS